MLAHALCRRSPLAATELASLVCARGLATLTLASTTSTAKLEQQLNIRQQSLKKTLAHFDTAPATATTTISASRPTVQRFLASLVKKPAVEVVLSPHQLAQQQQSEKRRLANATATLPLHARSQFFDRAHHPHTCITPGSIVSITSLTSTTKGKPVRFTGYVISLRRKGIDTSMTLRNYVLKTGVEQTYLVYSPMITDIRVLKYGNWARRAKLYYLRDQPNKVNWNLANDTSPKVQ